MPGNKINKTDIRSKLNFKIIFKNTEDLNKERNPRS